MTDDINIMKHLQPIVIGGDILAYSWVREMHRAFGITRTIVLATQDVKMLSSSKFTDYRLIDGLYEGETAYETLECIAREELARDPECRLIVLGCDDVHARILSRGKKRLEAAGVIVPYIDFELLDEITQKRRFYELCEELDMPFPKTWYFDCGNGPDKLPVEDFTYPLIAKPSNSAKFQAATIEAKRKIYEIETPEEFQHVWETIRISDYDAELVVQDFIPGDDNAIRTLTTFSDATGDVRIVSGGVVILQDHDPTALGNPLAILGEKEDVIIEGAKRFLKHIGYRGFANFDIKYDERDGTFRFFEVNTRAGRNTYYMSLGGVNFAQIVVEEFVLGRTVEYREAYRPFLYCCVPEYVLRRSVTNIDRLAEAIATCEFTDEPYPLHYHADSFQHNLWAAIMKVNQIRKFKRFYWDTGGKQLK